MLAEKKKKKKKGLRPATLLKETLAQVFSGEFCEIFKNTFFTEHLLTTAFVADQIILERITIFLERDLIQPGEFCMKVKR